MILPLLLLILWSSEVIKIKIIQFDSIDVAQQIKHFEIALSK